MRVPSGASWVTKASVRPAKLRKGRTAGKLVEAVEPVTNALPDESTAIPLAVQGEWPARVTIRLKGGEGAIDDWVKLTAPSTTLVGEPIAYRSASRAATRAVAGFEFARNERIRVEWPVLAPIDRREVRLLDRTGKPLPVELPLSEDPAHNSVVVDMSLSGLPRGDYLIELTAGRGGATEKSLLAVRIK